MRIEDSEYGPKFYAKLKEYPNEVSGFTKFPDKMIAGNRMYGHIEVKGMYHNFKWDKKDKSPAMGNPGLAEIKNILVLKIMPLLVGLSEDVEAINKKMGMKLEYPELTNENDSSGIHEPDGLPI